MFRPIEVARPAVLFLALAGSALAEAPSDWAKLAQNPLADVIKLPLENQFNQDVGHKNGTEYVLAYKPSMVSMLSQDWNVVNRLDLPLIYQPGIQPGDSDSHGLGDIQFESFFSPAGKRTFYWGLGPLFEFPSATDHSLGTKKWSSGLGGAAALVKGPWVVGARANQLWSFAGDREKPDVNRSTIEYFAYCNLGRGWSLGTSPVNIANWEAPQDEVWTIPVGGGIGKVVMRGRLPVNLKLEAYRYIDPAENDAEWSLIFDVQVLFTADLLFTPAD